MRVGLIVAMQRAKSMLIKSESPGHPGRMRLVIILATFLISIVAYRAYFEHGWFVQDDYTMVEIAGTKSILDSTGTITDSVYSRQARYLPVRAFLISAITHVSQEEYAAFHSFALHLANIALLLLVLRRFNISLMHAFIIGLVFSLFGRYRMMESPGVMIGGSGVNLFFILTSLLSLIKALEISNWNFRKYSWLALSTLSYLALIFTYEVAFPLALVISCVFFLFHPRSFRHERIFWIRECLCLLPYFALLCAYYLFFAQSQSQYDGARVAWSGDILIRLKYYLAYTFSYPINPRLSATAVVCLVCYFATLFLIIRAESADCPEKNGMHGKILGENANSGRLILFGGVFYFSSVVLFALNQWISPTAVMVHHTYLMTAGSSILLVTVPIILRWPFRDPARAIYSGFLIYVVAPLIILSGLNDTVDMYEKERGRTGPIKLLKHKIQSTVNDPARVDAILLKNFFPDYYGISSVNGALLQWFDFKKSIHSGREITHVEDGKIRFKGPLTYYHPPDTEFEAENNKTEIFYLDDAGDRVLSYFDTINFETGQNLHQLKQVMLDPVQCDAGYILEAILRGRARGGAVIITLSPEASPTGFLRNVSRIELNGRAVRKVAATGRSLYINTSGMPGVNYLFVKIVSKDKQFKSQISEVRAGAGHGAGVEVFAVNDEYPAFEKRGSVSGLDTAGLSQDLSVEWGSGFYGQEGNPANYWRWGSQRGEMRLLNTTQRSLAVTIVMKLRTTYKEHSDLTVTGPGFREGLKINADPLQYSRTLTIPPGRHAVLFESSAKNHAGIADPRFLSYMVADFRITDCNSRY